MASVGIAGTATAQDGARSSGIAVELSAVYVALNGGHFGHTEAGFGADFAAAFHFQSPVVLAVGIQGSRHRETELDTDVTGTQFYLEPRVLLPWHPAGAAPYLLLRGGLVSATGSKNGIDASRSGSSIGVGGGLVFRDGRAVSYYGSVSYHIVHFGGLTIDNVSNPNSDFTGNGLLIRAGLSVAINEL